MESTNKSSYHDTREQVARYKQALQTLYDAVAGIETYDTRLIAAMAQAKETLEL